MGRSGEKHDIYQYIWQLAGIVGLDPRPLTLRQLLYMVEGKRANDWQMVSAVMALIFNCHKSNETKPREPKDFNPFEYKKEKGREIKSMNELKGLFGAVQK